MLIYKTIKVIHHEPNAADFDKMSTTFIKDLQEDTETKDFCDYLKLNYLNPIPQWAYYCLQGCSINTNLYLENVHKRLKYFYLHGKKN